ncbi:hypothetical protein BDQ12DRAFT_720525 [Crucibulum laeve]|uniref:mRNA-decapping enzyme 1B n=1 Tax=Crucibulum laeve TaxID=68775 RepID=A0A5C3MAB9_9AGAR|nr:hypothetical protein BDQ12DRAFT_720525 [Crucibulum laeve]
MGPPRRTPLDEMNESSSQHTVHASAKQPSAPTGGKAAMSPASRYNHNLKVLRRRDPSITSIFDQFSHVCLYHHNGKKWEKQGFEGTMFLYERNAYPPYGFYILNRMGMDDHIQRVYPEDIVSHHGSYCIIKSFPNFTSQRLANIQPSSNKYSDVYSMPEIPDLRNIETPKVIGLWCFATSEREPLIPVMQRLHSYIKKNLPYPDEYRYGPDKPPPPNPSPHTADSSTDMSSDASDSQHSAQSDSSAGNSPRQYAHGNFELDKLFAKLAPTPVPVSSSRMSVDSLFAALGGAELAQPAVPTPTPPSTGLSLLDSIFASASAAPTPAASNPAPPAYPTPAFHQPQSYSSAPTSILSPTPSISTHNLQVLDQDVISTLLGFPSRSASAASTAYSNRSHPSSREGDNEYEERGRRGPPSDGGYSESSTVLDPEAENDMELQAAGASAGIPIVAEPALLDASQGRGKLNGHGRVHGDVTPRPPLNGLLNGSACELHTAPRLIAHSSSSSTVHAPSESQTEPPSEGQPQANGKPRSNRTLIPFTADSELWPYPRAPIDEEVSDSELVELDFTETSALSDLDAFRRVVQADRRDFTGRENGKQSKGKKRASRKERDARERELIEQSWDTPGSAAEADIELSRRGSVASLYSNPSTFSAPSSPPQVAARVRTPQEQINVTPAEMKTPTLGSRVKMTNGVLVNGNANPGVNGKTKTSKGKQPTALVDSEAVRQSLLASVGAQAQKPVAVDRNEFVREVLTLIHTDKAFVDSLWQEYNAMLS